MTTNNWPYPGSRWWKFDFHTHTPASTDWKDGDLTPQEWLLKFMTAEVDCVAITDHNSGVWVDHLKTAYEEMKKQAAQEQTPSGFRELTLFPGVEISVHDGIHVLALFDPSATTSDIDKLLGSVDFKGEAGTNNAVTTKSFLEVIQAINAVGAIAIPAHVDQERGLLTSSQGQTLIQNVEAEGLLAVEWIDLTQSWPESVAKEAPRFAHVLGSDCHSFEGGKAPGSRYTWVKMATPSLEGLRLALLDGNEISTHRSDYGIFEPFKVPEHVVTAIKVKDARYMGNGVPSKLSFSPFFNVIIGGRGTGKSTIVHALRLALMRGPELKALGTENGPLERFESFRQPAKGREEKGALRDDTIIDVEWQHDNELFQLLWQANNEKTLVKDKQNGQWEIAHNQFVSASRFPIQIYSQGQIATLAGGGRQALLAIIDKAADIEPLKQAFVDECLTFFRQQASLRELDGKLDNMPEVKRKYDETGKKLAALSQTNHAAILRAYSQARNQNREVGSLIEQLRGHEKRIKELADEIFLDDWSSQHFTEQDADLLGLRHELAQQVNKVRTELLKQANSLGILLTSLTKDPRYAQWWSRNQKASAQYESLQKQLIAQGVSDPQEFARLTQERQQLEAQCKMLEKMQVDREALLKQIEQQQKTLTRSRQDITAKRCSFIETTIANNQHVRMKIVPFGFDANQIERELRELIEVTDDRFADDLLTYDKNRNPSGGLAFNYVEEMQKENVDPVDVVEAFQEILLNPDDYEIGGHFRNFLNRKLERPEFSDRVLTWFPEDDLQIEYKREKKWISISEGSQGQRSAALLAFLLAFGNDPIVLDQPEDDLDNHLIFELIVQQIRENKLRRQLIVVTHNPNVVVNGDAELVHVMNFRSGQCVVQQSGALQERAVRDEVCRVLEGGRVAFQQRWNRLGREV